MSSLSLLSCPLQNEEDITKLKKRLQLGERQRSDFDIYNELIARVHVAANNEDASDVLNVKQHGTNPGAKNATLVVFIC